MIKTVVIAVALSLLTFVCGYLLWYIFRGSRRRRARGLAPMKGSEEPKEEETDTVGPWGFGKDAYCYPKINDVMGFDFVKVVKVPDELRGVKGGKRVTDSPAQLDAGAARPTVTATRTSRPSTEDIDNVPYPERAEDRYLPSRRDETPAPQITEPRVEDDDTVEEVSREESISVDIQADLENIQFQWNHRDYDEAFNDDLCAEIIEDGQRSGAIIDDPEIEDDTEQRIEDMREFQRMQAAHEAADASLDDTFGASIMEQLNDLNPEDGEEEEKEKPATEDNGQQEYLEVDLEPDDIPETE